MNNWGKHTCFCSEYTDWTG